MTTETALSLVKRKKSFQEKEEPKLQLKEASYYKKLKNKVVHCELCPRACMIPEGQWGNCSARKNIGGRLYSMVYGKPVSMALDPIEKKPLFHFMPGKEAMSIATSGCNFHCLFCQNWQISQAKPEEVPYVDFSPVSVVDETMVSDCKMISYTYTEPSIFYEYMYDIAKLAREQKIKNVSVTNGFINPEPLNELCKFLDASNIDFKGNDEMYAKICGAWRKPVEETIKIMHEKGVWIEITNLIIPGHNDKEEDIKEIISWTKKNVGVDVPLHFSAFYPSYKMLTTPSTKPEIIMKARKLAMKAGLNYVYAGNIPEDEGLTTYCPQCKKPVITRSGFYLKESLLINGRCPYCNEKIPGVWE